MYINLSAWKHGQQTKAKLIVQILPADSKDAPKEALEKSVGIDGVIIAPIVDDGDGCLNAAIYTYGIEEASACAIINTIKGLLHKPSTSGCESCSEMITMLDILFKIVDEAPQKIGMLSEAMFTVFKFHVAAESGLPIKKAEDVQYDHNMSLAYNCGKFLGDIADSSTSPTQDIGSSDN
jgi:hypothetical protein